REITQIQPQNLHHRHKEGNTAAVRRTQSSPSVSSFPRAPSLQPLFAVTDRGCFLELGVRRLCLLSCASVAVCLLFTFASSFAFFTVRVHSLFTVRVRVRLEATLLCFKLCDQAACSTQLSNCSLLSPP
ncbi:hypothetical protein S245_030505, partial [Arachis hypogaea]